MTEKRFTVHIKWSNYEKTEGEIELFDNGQPLLISDCVEDVQWIKSLLNELNDENEQLKLDLKVANDGADLYWCINEALAKENMELKQEREQLNSQLNRLSDELFCEDCHTCRHSESIDITVKCSNGEGVTTYHSGCDFYEIDERFIV